MEELDVLQAPAKDMRFLAEKNHEFPVAFNFGGPRFFEYESGSPLNRAERRKMARDARKAAKKSK